MCMCLLALFCGACLPNAAAAEAADGQTGSLTLHYSREGAGFSELNIRIYRVAEFSNDGGYALTAPFDRYSVKIHNIVSQKEWSDTAGTLESYILADAIAPYAAAPTGADGTVVFENLQTGLYFVAGVDAETLNGRFRFEPFLIFVPTPVDGENNYDMVAKPKAGAVTPIARYTVIKLWKDIGYADSRPQEVRVEIYKDGVHWQTVSLSQSNNWSFDWETEDTAARWSVAEKDVPAGYSVTVMEQEDTFAIVNTKDGAPPSPPQTGDTTPWWLYVLLMGISGVGLIIVGILPKRKSL